MQANCNCSAPQSSIRHLPAKVYFRTAAAQCGLASKKCPALGRAGPSFDTDEPATALDSDDVLQATVQLQFVQQRRWCLQPDVRSSWYQLLDNESVARLCPVLTAAILLPAGALLAAPQATLQFLAAEGSKPGPSLAGQAISATFAQLVGLTWLVQASVIMMVKSCVSRDQLGSTTCQRMLMATLLPVPGSLLSLSKAASASCSMAGSTVIAALQFSNFCIHAILHLKHHPWFFVKVFWPLAVTMLVTEVMPTNWTFMEGAGTGPFQAVLAAVLSVKVISRVPRLAARFAPRVGRRWLLPIVNWLGRQVLPRLTAVLAKILPRLARHIRKLIPKLTKFSTRLAGRMAPRYAQDQLAGATQQIAFPSADGLLTDTVAKCIDFMPPKNSTSWCYMGLLAVQLMMIVNAYSPELLFNTSAVAAASSLVTSNFDAQVATAAVAAVHATGAALATAADSSTDAWLGLLRYVKFTWGAGFFVAAFACNCLKTAADRQHLWKLANRQLNMALALLLAGTAVVLVLGIESGAVVASIYAWLQITAAAAGACWCCTQAAAPGISFAQIGAVANTDTPTGSAMGSYLSQQPQAQQLSSNDVSACATGSACADSCSGAGGPAVVQGQSSCDHFNRLSPLSTIQWETVEQSDSRYAAVMHTTVLLLTLLQLAL